MNPDTPPELARLLSLKRHEQPPDDFVDDFLVEFHRRQRADLLKVSAWQLFKDRVAAACHQVRWLAQPRWAYGIGAAYALVMVGFYFNSGRPVSDQELAAARQRAAQNVPSGAIYAEGTRGGASVKMGEVTPGPGLPAIGPNAAAGRVPVTSQKEEVLDAAAGGQFRRFPTDPGASSRLIRFYPTRTMPHGDSTVSPSAPAETGNGGLIIIVR